MATLQFKDTGLYKVMETSEVVSALGFTVANNQQLSQVVATLYKHGAHAGTENIRANLYADFDLTKKIATGTLFPIDSVPNMGTYWRGQIGLTFPTRPWLKSGNTYYIGIETTGYTRNASAYYLSFEMNDDLSLISAMVGLRSVGAEK